MLDQKLGVVITHTIIIFKCMKASSQCQKVSEKFVHDITERHFERVFNPIIKAKEMVLNGSCKTLFAQSVIIAAQSDSVVLEEAFSTKFSNNAATPGRTCDQATLWLLFLPKPCLAGFFEITFKSDSKAHCMTPIMGFGQQ